MAIYEGLLDSTSYDALFDQFKTIFTNELGATTVSDTGSSSSRIMIFSVPISDKKIKIYAYSNSRPAIAILNPDDSVYKVGAIANSLGATYAYKAVLFNNCITLLVANNNMAYLGTVLAMHKALNTNVYVCANSIASVASTPSCDRSWASPIWSSTNSVYQPTSGLTVDGKMLLGPILLFDSNFSPNRLLEGPIVDVAIADVSSLSHGTKVQFGTKKYLKSNGYATTTLYRYE